MDEKELYEEDELKNPYTLGRREFIKKSLNVAGFVACAAALSSITSLTSCSKENNGSGPIAPIIENPATETEGRKAMKNATDTVMGEKGYTYEIKYDELIFSPGGGQGRFDLVVYVDTNDDGQDDLKLGMNYVTEGESRQNLQDTARYKFKEIVKTDLTTKSYLTEEFKKWMRDVA